MPAILAASMPLIARRGLEGEEFGLVFAPGELGLEDARSTEDERTRVELARVVRTAPAAAIESCRSAASMRSFFLTSMSAEFRKDWNVAWGKDGN